MPQEITLTSDGSQRFTTTLDGQTYEFEVSYNNRVGIWTMNINLNGEPLVNGVGLLSGVDILKQHIFELDNMFVINIEDGVSDATSENLGTEVKLFKLSDEEVLAIGQTI